jgi:arginyl-tRNA synthetase
MPGRDRAVHVANGSVLGPDRKMLKSRSGESIKLVELLDEAVHRAATTVRSLNPDLPDEELAVLSNQVGIGSLKYADLSTDRARDYVFDWDRMLSLEGNTAVYLQYAQARCRSIFRKGNIEATPYAAGTVSVRIGEPAERQLALSLLGFGLAVDSVLETWSPHKLCGYLFDLAGTYTTFYEQCPVLKASDPAVRESRLMLCWLTAAVLQAGLAMLGIAAPERM